MIQIVVQCRSFKHVPHVGAVFWANLQVALLALMEQSTASPLTPAARAGCSRIQAEALPGC